MAFLFSLFSSTNNEVDSWSEFEVQAEIWERNSVTGARRKVVKLVLEGS